jgi:hypothetical protein
LFFEAEKFPFKNLKGKISQKVSLFCLFSSSVLFVSRVWCFSFPPPIEREEERGKPNEDTAPLEAKQKHPKPTLRESRYPHFSANSFVE